MADQRAGGTTDPSSTAGGPQERARNQEGSAQGRDRVQEAGAQGRDSAREGGIQGRERPRREKPRTTSGRRRGHGTLRRRSLPLPSRAARRSLPSSTPSKRRFEPSRCNPS